MRTLAPFALAALCACASPTSTTPNALAAWTVNNPMALQHGLDSRRFRTRVSSSYTVPIGGSNNIVDLIVLQGESNAVGRGLNTSATVDELAPHPRVRILNVDTLLFEALDIPLNNSMEQGTDGTHGPELGLANEVEADRLGTGNVYLVKAAADGTFISHWFEDDDLQLYNDILVPRLDAAIAILEGLNLPYRITVWQSIGINDFRFGTYPSSVPWIADMETFKAQFRADYGADCRFISTEFSPGIFDWNDALNEMTETDTLQNVISYAGTTTYDGLHWDYASLKILATRWVDVMTGAGIGAGASASTLTVSGAGRARVVAAGSAAGVLTATGSGVTYDPPDFTNLTLWLKSGNNVTLSAGKFAGWGSATTPNHDMVQGTSSKQPTSVIESSLEAPDFDGVDDEMHISPYAALSEFVSAGKDAFHIFLAFEADTATGTAADAITYTNNCLIGDDLGYLGVFLKTVLGTSYVQAYLWDGLAKTTPVESASAITTGGARHIVEVKFSSGSMSLRVDDGAFTTPTTGISPIQIVNGLLHLGHISGSLYFDGRQLEIFMYKAVLSAPNTSSIRTYLGTAHGVSV